MRSFFSNYLILEPKMLNYILPCLTDSICGMQLRVCALLFPGVRLLALSQNLQEDQLLAWWSPLVLILYENGIIAVYVS